MPFLVQNLEEIFEGQDISLVWRRDGIKALPDTKNERLRAYRRYADLKTGAVFRLVGQLVTEGNGCDDLMSSMAYVPPSSLSLSIFSKHFQYHLIHYRGIKIKTNEWITTQQMAQPPPNRLPPALPIPLPCTRRRQTRIHRRSPQQRILLADHPRSEPYTGRRYRGPGVEDQESTGH